ncbi:LOW QUALITY PROTEIN: mitogen-activated protein kinase 15 [Rhynchocyon petersi]
MCAAEVEVDRRIAQRYLLKRRLGKGAYGIVWKAVERRTGEVVAIKKIFDAFRDKTDAQRTFREVTLLQEFEGHPNIIRLLDIIPAENDRDLYLVLESMDTDLNAVIRKGLLLKDVHKRYIFYQLLRATKFIHSGNVIHRDQKPANVLLDTSCLVKLCDFGLARSLSQLPGGSEGQALTEYVATRWYRAPEVLLSSHWYTPGVDMWSLGCILGEMLRGRPLFPGSSSLHQLELILEHVPPPPKEALLPPGGAVRASDVDLMGFEDTAPEWGVSWGCLRPRQTLDALLPPNTPPEALDLLRRLLVFTPDKRLSAAQALQHPYVQRFHCPALEWTLRTDVRLPLDEGIQLSVPEYRSRLYQMILERRGHSHVQGSEDLGDMPAGAGSQALKSPVHLPEPRTRGLSVQGRPPEAEAVSLAAPSWVKPHIRALEPSLTTQAAAGVVNQALIRKERNPIRGMREASAQRDTRPKPRPGRRMFSVSTTQGVLGSEKASLGGCAQAYGTIRQSALCRLPLPPRTPL